MFDTDNNKTNKSFSRVDGSSEISAGGSMQFGDVSAGGCATWEMYQSGDVPVWGFPVLKCVSLETLTSHILGVQFLC